MAHASDLQCNAPVEIKRKFPPAMTRPFLPVQQSFDPGNSACKQSGSSGCERAVETVQREGVPRCQSQAIE